MKKRILATITTLLITQSVFAHNHEESKIQWNNLEIDYVENDVDGAGTIKPKGASFKATKLINENIFAIAGVSHISESIQSLDMEITNISVGLGYQHAYSNQVSLYTMATYEDYQSEVENIDIDLNGFNIALGLRYLANPNFEVDSRITYVDIEEENEIALKVKGYYQIKNDLFVGLGYNFYEGNNGQLEAGIRYSF